MITRAAIAGQVHGGFAASMNTLFLASDALALVGAIVAG